MGGRDEGGRGLDRTRLEDYDSYRPLDDQDRNRDRDRRWPGPDPRVRGRPRADSIPDRPLFYNKSWVSSDYKPKNRSTSIAIPGTEKSKDEPLTIDEAATGDACPPRTNNPQPEHHPVKAWAQYDESAMDVDDESPAPHSSTETSHNGRKVSNGLIGKDGLRGMS